MSRAARALAKGVPVGLPGTRDRNLSVLLVRVDCLRVYEGRVACPIMTTLSTGPRVG
jgi:hypothetical protein